MSSGKDIAEFPNVAAKLQKPTKQSAFEKQKADAVAKRQREEAETAAVLKDFVESFDHDGGGDDDDDDNNRHGNAPPRQPSGGGFPRSGFGAPPPSGGASRRHFGASGLKSGPGSLGPPPTSFGKKRSFQDYAARGPREKTTLGFDEDDRGDRSRGGRPSAARGFSASDDEDMTNHGGDRAEEKAVAKPTLRLSQLPPGTSPAVIKALMPGHLVVDNVKILPQTGAAANSERKSTVAIVTLSQETPANEIDAAVSALQKRYLGYGYYMSLHRHLSSAVSSAAAAPYLGSSTTGSHPFGAKPVEQPSGRQNRPAHQDFHRGFAPPTSYNQPMGGVNRANLLHVHVKPPQDIRTIQLINRVIERVLEHGPEFEALLMSRPEVQRDERWAWIWDARSEGGIWYRWRLWEIVTGSDARRTKGKFVPVFDGGHAWKTPDKALPFEYSTRLDEFVSDPDYNSSDDEDMDGEDNHDVQTGDVEKTFLNPLEKAKLIHLLARLPTTLSKVRKGDIARVTTFAIMHASRGVDEVVEIIVSNVQNPYSLTGANSDRKQHGKDSQLGGTAEESAPSEGVDVSAGSLVGLYVVSDILSSSSTSGVRHAWRFRQLFEAALKDHKTFEALGMMPEKLGWGRLRAEKWKRSVGLVLNLWEGWCVFPAEGQELFVHSFENPPSLKVESKAEDDLVRKGRWKTVEATRDGGGDMPYVASAAGGAALGSSEEDVGGEPMQEDDVAGEAIDEEDVEGVSIDEDDIEGEPIGDDDIEGEPMDEDEIQEEQQQQPRLPSQSEPGGEGDAARGKEASGGGTQTRKRMRAVDMFADSDESGGKD